MAQLRKPEGFEKEKLFVLPEHMLAELSRFDLTRGLYVSDIGFFPRAAYHYRERPEGCAAHIFIYCTEGQGWIETGGRTLPVAERQLVVIPAGVPHRYGAAEGSPWSIYWFHLRGEFVLSFIQLYGLEAGPLHLPIGVYSELSECIERCYGLLIDKPFSLPVQAYVSQSIGQMLGGIGLMAGGSSGDKKRRLDLEQATRYMNEHLGDTVKLPELAAHIGLSKAHLIYLFNQETGFSPIEYFLRMKMQKASQLLSLTGLSVKEVAAEVGIPDPYYFSRLFKKRMGVSPSEYRNVPKG